MSRSAVAHGKNAAPPKAAPASAPWRSPAVSVPARMAAAAAAAAAADALAAVRAAAGGDTTALAALASKVLGYGVVAGAAVLKLPQARAARDCACAGTRCAVTGLR